jgi:hypothetical protein
MWPTRSVAPSAPATLAAGAVVAPGAAGFSVGFAGALVGAAEVG